MATEEGIIIKIDADTAWVKTKKSKSCEGCGSRGACSIMGGGDEMEVEAVNAVGGKIGDRVVLNFDTTPLLKATFLIYVFPILCMLAGALMGANIAPRFNFDPSIFAAVCGFSFFGLAFVYVRIRGNRMSQEDQYRPKIIRILTQH
jgi:sigma-E factor negative regulatory protein RseC